MKAGRGIDGKSGSPEVGNTAIDNGQMTVDNCSSGTAADRSYYC